MLLLSVEFVSLDVTGLSSTITISSILASALFSYRSPDLVSSKLNVTLGFEVPSFLDIEFSVTSVIPVTVKVERCSLSVSEY